MQSYATAVPTTVVVRSIAIGSTTPCDPHEEKHRCLIWHQPCKSSFEYFSGTNLMELSSCAPEIRFFLLPWPSPSAPVCLPFRHKPNRWCDTAFPWLIFR